MTAITPVPKDLPIYSFYPDSWSLIKALLQEACKLTGPASSEFDQSADYLEGDEAKEVSAFLETLRNTRTPMFTFTARIIESGAEVKELKWRLAEDAYRLAILDVRDVKSCAYIRMELPSNAYWQLRMNRYELDLRERFKHVVVNVRDSGRFYPIRTLLERMSIFWEEKSRHVVVEGFVILGLDPKRG